MLKRIATFLLGIGLVSLGILFFIAPQRSYLVESVLKYWPVFLILAGLVRVGGHLLDRQPRSPMGGMLLTALGGILLSVNLTGETRIFTVIGTHWFWLLLAFVAARVMRQYTHSISDGPRPAAFSPLGVVLMGLIAAVGLGAHWMSSHSDQLAGVRLPFKLNNVRDIFNSEYSIADQTAKTFTLPANARLVFDSFDGDVNIMASPTQTVSAKIVRRIRSSDETAAQSASKHINLDIRSQGNQRIFSIAADQVEPDYVVTLTIEIPKGSVAGVDANVISGALSLTGMKGDHSLREIATATVTDNEGNVSAAGVRTIRCDRLRGTVTIERASREIALRDIAGPVSINTSGGSAKLERVDGPVEFAGRNVRIDAREIAQGSNASPVLTNFKDLTDCRLVLNRVRGTVRVSGARTRMDITGINGDLDVNSTGERLKVASVSGSLNVKIEDGSVEASELQGPSDIKATRDVTVRNFGGTTAIATRLGIVTLTMDRPLTADVTASSEHGQVRVSVPEDSDFRLEASSGYGKVKVRGFDSLGLSHGPRMTSVSYAENPGAPLINVRSTNGDIIISPSGRSLATREGRASN